MYCDYSKALFHTAVPEQHSSTGQEKYFLSIFSFEEDCLVSVRVQFVTD